MSVHDRNGNLAFDGVYYYQYDFLNRLCLVSRAGTLSAGDFENS